MSILIRITDEMRWVAYELMNVISVCCLCEMLPMMVMDSVVSCRCSTTWQPICIGREPMDRPEVVGEVGHLWAFSELSVDAQFR